MSNTTAHAAMPLLLVTMILAAGGLVAEEINREFRETFDVRPGMRLVLEHGDGDVTVEPWDEDSLLVEVVFRAETSTMGWSKSTELTVDFRQDGDTIHVVGNEPKRVSVGISAYRELEYLYTIKAPSYLEIQSEGEDGDVEIGGWRASIGLKLEDGDIELRDIDNARTEILLEDGDLSIEGLRGEIKIECEDGDVEIFDCEIATGSIHTDDGDIDIDRCRGSLALTLADGDAEVRSMAAEKLDVRADDGSISLTLLASEGLDVKVRSTDGDVVLDLDPDISASFELETRDGRIRVNAADVNDLVQERRHVSGRLGTGEGSISVRTGDGGITLRQ